MKRFILRLLLAYTIISIVVVAGVIAINKHDHNEHQIPRKTLYVVNMTGDSITVSISGAYTKEEKRKMDDKPDDYVFMEQEQPLPYHYEEGVERQAAAFYIPHKHDKKIEFPDDFVLHIKSAKRNITLNKEQVTGRINGRYDQNWWVIYVHPSWLEPPKPEVVDTTIFVSNGIRYRYLLQPDEVEVIHGVPEYRDSVFIPATVAHDGKTYRVTAVGKYAMAGGLKAFTYPNAIRHIDEGAFKQSTGLRRVSFPDSLRSIGKEAFSFCTVMQTFTFPDSLETIGERAFEVCCGITSITFPPRVTVIRQGTFQECSRLERITLPGTITSIEAFAFAGCRALKNVEAHAQTPIELPEDESPFKDVDLNRVTLTVPVRTKQRYQSAPVWKDFGKIVERN
ncbi:MAG: leucine-rich repeat domain-containing protein [Tannerella sp.]|jgi:hypothetical protein|nr:leucine-rich repeat domain-containing protein [Tannerella sp.]